MHISGISPRILTGLGWTGQGIGRSLYEACEAQALQAGVTQLDCFASMNAEGFYAAIGFERIKRVEVVVFGLNRQKSAVGIDRLGPSWEEILQKLPTFQTVPVALDDDMAVGDRVDTP